MENLKMYIKNENLNEYEKENKKVSFKNLIEKIFIEMIMCNDITKILNDCNYNIDLEIGTDYDEESDEYVDIYQYFIVDFDDYMYTKLEQFKKQFGKEFILYYINELDIYVLGVTHFGTGWGYVLTDIEPTENINNSDF